MSTEAAPKPAEHWHHYASLPEQHEATTLGMWVFLATEVMIFGGLFTAFAVYFHKYAPSFEDGSRHLNLLIGAVNTVVLLTSSLTMALAVRAAAMDRRTVLVRCLALTVLLGAVFLGLKVVEYYKDYKENLVPGLAFDRDEWKAPANADHVQMFLVFYYILTGLHAAHMIVGMGVLIALIVLARRGVFAGGNWSQIEIWGLYWHFVDIVWIFLLPLLYLLGTHSSLF